MIGKETITAAILTLDEARNLRELLPALAWADEIVVVDGRSEDGTVEIATATNRDWTEVPVAGGYAGAGRGVGVADMARALRTGRPHRADGALAYHVLDVLESLLEAATQDQSVDVASTVARPAAVPLGASPESA